MLKIGTLQALMRHQVKPNLIHLVEASLAKFASLARKAEALEFRNSG